MGNMDLEKCLLTKIGKLVWKEFDLQDRKYAHFSGSILTLHVSMLDSRS